MTKYLVTIETPAPVNPPTVNHFEALLANPNNRGMIKYVEEL